MNARTTLIAAFFTTVACLPLTSPASGSPISRPGSILVDALSYKSFLINADTLNEQPLVLHFNSASETLIDVKVYKKETGELLAAMTRPSDTCIVIIPKEAKPAKEQKKEDPAASTLSYRVEIHNLGFTGASLFWNAPYLLAATTVDVNEAKAKTSSAAVDTAN